MGILIAHVAAAALSAATAAKPFVSGGGFFMRI
jgi:hypothetical protein